MEGGTEGRRTEEEKMKPSVAIKQHIVNYIKTFKSTASERVLKSIRPSS